MSALPLTAIVVNYNAGAWLLRCVSSLLSEQVSEVIVVDNDSLDDSLKILKQGLPQALASGQLKIKLQGKNTGFSQACNAGANMACQPYLLFINPDSLAHSGSVSNLLLRFCQQSGYGLIGGKIFNIDGTVQYQAKREFPALGLFKPRMVFEYSARPENTDEQAEIQAVPAISGSCMLTSKALYTKIGGFDERYTLHCEDLDLCAKVHELGLQVGYVESAHFTHAKGVCSTSNPLWVEWQKHKSMIYFYLKHQPKLYNPLDLLVVIPGLITHMAWVWFKIKLLRRKQS